MPTPPDRIYLSADSGDFVYVDGKCYRKEGLPGEITHTKEAAYASCEECADSPYFNTPTVTKSVASTPTVTKSVASTPTVTITPTKDSGSSATCLWDNELKLTVSDPSGGHAGDIDGDSVIVGAPTAGASNDGAAYIFERSTGWPLTETQKLVASDGQQDDKFGEVVAISGDYAIVGASQEDTNGTNAGAAYIFERSGSTWSEVKKILPSDGGSSDWFGRSVAISGDYAIVGAMQWDQSPAYQKGAAYIFKRDPSTGWPSTETQKLVASDGDKDDRFGMSVAIDGNYAIVGAFKEGYSNSDEGGAAYIFYRSGSTWSEVKKIESSVREPNDQFGIAVDIDGDSVIVGAQFADGAQSSGPNSTAGAAFIFERDPSTGWPSTETQKLVASDGQGVDYFGVTVAIDGNYAIVGAAQEDTNGASAGAAYIFERDPSTGWPFYETQKIQASDVQAGDMFGFSASISDCSAIISAGSGAYILGPSTAQTPTVTVTKSVVSTPTVTKSVASTPTVTMTPCDDGSGFCNCDSGNSYTVSGGAGIGIPDMDGTYTYHSTLTGGGCSGPNTPAGCGTNSMYANTGSGTTYYLFQCCSSLIGTNYWCCGPTPGDSGAGGAVNTVSADTSSGVAGPGGECPDGVSWSSAGITVTQL